MNIGQRLASVKRVIFDRQSIQQQMVTFIQQLQQFPPLFQHLQNNPHVLAQLLQQFKWKQEQNTRDMQQRLNMSPQMNNQSNQQPINQSQNNNNNIQTVGGLIRTLQARQLQQQQQQHQQNLQQIQQIQQNQQQNNQNNNQNNNNVNVMNTISIQPPNSSNNSGLLPALENENSDKITNSNKDDIIILNDNDTDNDINMSNNNNVNNANANNSQTNNNNNNANSSNNNNNANGSTISSIPPLLTPSKQTPSQKQLDFSQLKNMQLNFNDDVKSHESEQNISNNNSKQSQQQSPLKRSFSAMGKKNSHENNNNKINNNNAELPPMKRRRLNNDKSITILSDESNKERETRKKKKRKDNKKKGVGVGSGYTTRSISRRKQKEEEIVSILSNKENATSNNLPSFSDMIAASTTETPNDIIDNNEFLNDPLISEIANKMFEIRQITNNKRMATPPIITANINKGLDVLLQAIDEMDTNTNNCKKEEETNATITKRKNGELFVVDKRNENGNGSDANINKIRTELGLNYKSFIINTESVLMKQTPNDIGFKNKLQLLSFEFNNNYNNGLLQVYKTVNHKMFKDKFIKCNGNINEYYNIWNQCIKLHLISQLNQWLKNYKIKESIGLIFSIMDHLFSYKLYTKLCAIENINQGVGEIEKGEVPDQLPKPNCNQNKKQSEKDIYLPIKGNLIFANIENDINKLKQIENKYILWLFDYWKKVLLQSAEPVKCLCRSYLINTWPNPFKQKLYSIIKQTPHSPNTTILKSKSMSPNSNTSKNNSPNKLLKKSKTPPNVLSKNNHFIRNTQSNKSISINGIINTNNISQIPSSSVCGKTFINALQCAEHSKQCKECINRQKAIN